MNRAQEVARLEEARRALGLREGISEPDREAAAEGGCGVIGFASSVPVAGKHLLSALTQMRNRGNGKGGGVAMVGLDPDQFGVSQDIMSTDYLLAIAYLEPDARSEVEDSHIHPNYEVDAVHEVEHLADFSEVDGLELAPPLVTCYFVRPKAEAVAAFEAEAKLDGVRGVEDEFVYQTTYALNRRYYGDQAYRAFVLSHGRDQLVLKGVAYADDVVRYYRLEDKTAHVWIGHHRYPTKGRVWHPGGAHPFIGMHEALVHNGDFANYAAVSSYLAQRNIYPLFQTDTEVSALVFDLHHRTYRYPMEYLIESLAPTTERDFALLEPKRQQIYAQLQRTHMHGSPDGPWFFIIAQSAGDLERREHRLIGITDTSMLRPQVFAMQRGEASIGLTASEKQGIDAVLASLAEDDDRFWPRADRYWNARGGSHTDGGAFIFTVSEKDGAADGFELVCTDKFGQEVDVFEAGEAEFDPAALVGMSSRRSTASDVLPENPNANGAGGNGARKSEANGAHAAGEDSSAADAGLASVVAALMTWNESELRAWLSEEVERAASGGDARRSSIGRLTRLLDRRVPSPKIRRSRLLSRVQAALNETFDAVETSPCQDFAFLRIPLAAAPSPKSEGQCLIIHAEAYEPEGPRSVAMAMVAAYKQGWRNFLIYACRGHRFIANGFGPKSSGVQVDVYGSSGDYLASGIDGASVHVHGSAQDQLGQILKSGEMVVHGDVGQTFMYGAKGGNVYVLGNAAGRPLINAVGKPRVVINGTCLDYLAESFMAGDPLDGGGFVIVNGISLDHEGRVQEMETPYPGGNLFSLASGGAIYLRDPHQRVTQAQLNGGEFETMSDADWALIEPHLEANEEHFGIARERLLTVDGKLERPSAVYRKVRPTRNKALQAEEAWVTKGGKAQGG